MQVFIIGDALTTFNTLDSRRLRKQLVECKQILAVYNNNNSNAWKNHPIVKSYKPYQKWLLVYTWLLEEFLKNESDMLMVTQYNQWLIKNVPIFHTEEYFNQMKRRLYTKNNKFYKQFANLGESLINWYYVDNQWLYYQNGKKTNNKI